MSEGEQTANKKRWYVVQVASSGENFVQKALQTRIEEKGMDDYFDEIMVPEEQVMTVRGGQKTSTTRKFFPSYVLVKMLVTDDTWHLVKSTPKVKGFIGGEKPSPISDKEADQILNRVQEGAEKPKPKVLFEVGEVVHIREGPFTDFNGVVEEVNYEKNRLRVSVLIFGRSTPVDLEFSQVEKT